MSNDIRKAAEQASTPEQLARYVTTGDRRAYIRAWVADLRRAQGMPTIRAYWLARRMWESYQ
jgi:hypothetical protein